MSTTTSKVPETFRELGDLLEDASQYTTNVEAIGELITPQNLSTLCTVKDIGSERFYRYVSGVCSFIHQYSVKPVPYTCCCSLSSAPSVLISTHDFQV
jgi:hypothetical protein